MHIVIALVIVAVTALLAILGLRSDAGEKSAPAPAEPKRAAPDGKRTPAVADVTALDRADLEKRLGELADAPEPEKKMGAMCYDMVMPPARAEYVCPECGEKTLYANRYRMEQDDEKDGEDASDDTDARTVDGGVIEDINHGIAATRREMQRLRKSAGAAVRLDESEFCRKCAPEAKNPSLRLIVTHEDGTEHLTRDIGSHDIRLISEFLEGKTAHTTSNDGVVPLAGRMDRIRALLGLEGETPEKKPEPVEAE